MWFVFDANNSSMGVGDRKKEEGDADAVHGKTELEVLLHLTHI